MSTTMLGRARDIAVDGARVRYYATPPRPTQLLLIHGTSAHAMWWYRVVPLLAAEHQCLTIDLSGHGESEHRETYSIRTWQHELEAVLEHAGASAPVMVGHSRGGRLGVLALAERPHLARGLLILDAAVRPPDRHRPDAPVPQRQRRYDSFEQARAAFRLLPPDLEPSAEVLDPVAAYAIRHQNGWWSWKYDRRTFTGFDDAHVSAAAAQLRTPTAILLGARSDVVDAEMLDYMRGMLPVTETATIADAGHHLLLDQPAPTAAFIAAAARRMVDARTY